MQRNFPYQAYLSAVLLLGVILGYELMTTLYPMLPPLAGFLMFYAYGKREKPTTAAVLIYLLLFEADRGYPLFTSWIFFGVWWMVFLPWFRNQVICKNCFPPVAVALFYGGYGAALAFLSMLYNLDLTIDPLFLLYDTAVDTLLIYLMAWRGGRR